MKNSRANFTKLPDIFNDFPPFASLVTRQFKTLHDKRLARGWCVWMRAARAGSTMAAGGAAVERKDTIEQEISIPQVFTLFTNAK